MSRGRAKSHRQQNKGAFFSVAVIVSILLVVLSVRCMQLYAKDNEYAQKEAELKAQYESEVDRSEEIEEYEEYSKTDDYIIEMAREKLGLVFEDEKIFRQED
ncbi:MAG: septum formation initiator family protein [Eubacterium sp.]|nr:septum formation initiator family protein [Eubacterium sp.]